MSGPVCLVIPKHNWSFFFLCIWLGWAALVLQRFACWDIYIYKKWHTAKYHINRGGQVSWRREQPFWVSDEKRAENLHCTLCTRQRSSTCGIISSTAFLLKWARRDSRGESCYCDRDTSSGRKSETGGWRLVWRNHLFWRMQWLTRSETFQGGFGPSQNGTADVRDD